MNNFKSQVIPRCKEINNDVHVLFIRLYKAYLKGNYVQC